MRDKSTVVEIQRCCSSPYSSCLKTVFDTVSVSIVVQKLSLLESNLTDRKSREKLGNAVRYFGDLNYGVPQGSVLVPTLFLVCINDIWIMTISISIHLVGNASVDNKKCSP